jgi:hypothetical protein
MQNLIDAKLLLRVFSLAEQHGEDVLTAAGKGFRLDGLQVATGFDGYDLYFWYGDLTLTLGFHQKYFIDARSEQQIDEFHQVLFRIAKAYA